MQPLEPGSPQTVRGWLRSTARNTAMIVVAATITGIREQAFRRDFVRFAQTSAFRLFRALEKPGMWCAWNPVS